VSTDGDESPAAGVRGRSGTPVSLSDALGVETHAGADIGVGAGAGDLVGDLNS